MLIVADSNESKQIERRYLDNLFQKRVDALVIASVDLKAPNVARFAAHNIPVIFIDNLPQYRDASTKFVIVDNRQASRMAVRALLECGHRQIAILVGTVEETTGAERLAGYAEELRENGIAIDPALIAYGNFKQNDGYRCMKQLLAKRHTHPFSAVYVTSEMMTAGALQAIREAALQIGRDISLIGFDVHDELGLTTPKITTIRQPEMEIGVQTGQLLLQLLNPVKYGAPDSTQVLTQVYLQQGDSVASI